MSQYGILGSQGAQLTLESIGVIFIVGANIFKESLCSPLLEKPHQRRPQCLTSICGYLCDRCASPTTLLDVTPGNLFEFEISCDISRDEDVGELAIGHQELRHQINIPVIHTAVLFPRFFTLVVIAVLLEKLNKGQTMNWSGA